MIRRGVAVTWKPGDLVAGRLRAYEVRPTCSDVLTKDTTRISRCFTRFLSSNNDKPHYHCVTCKRVPTPFESFASNCLSTFSGTLTPPPQGSRTAYRALCDDHVSVQASIQEPLRSASWDGIDEAVEAILCSPTCMRRSV